MNRKVIKIFILLGLIFWNQKVCSTEFLTDSPVPAAYEEVFVNLHATTQNTKNGTSSRLPAVESLVGVYPDFQVRAIAPVVLAQPDRKSTRLNSSH